jgi:hypothetical protein
VRPCRPIPSRWQRPRPAQRSAGEGDAPQAYFHFHPQATYATRMDVATWLGELERIELGFDQ